MTTHERPLGIVLIVLYFGVFGVIGALGGACAMIAGGTMDTMMETMRQAGEPGGPDTPMPMGHEMPRLGFMFVVASLIGVIASVLQVAAAYGLWSFQRWGRQLGFYLAAFAIVWGIFWYLAYSSMIGTYGTLWFLVGLALNGAIVWYLNTPDIKRLYEGTAVRPTGTI